MTSYCDPRRDSEQSLLGLVKYDKRTLTSPHIHKLRSQRLLAEDGPRRTRINNTRRLDLRRRRDAQASRRTSTYHTDLSRNPDLRTRTRLALCSCVIQRPCAGWSRATAGGQQRPGAFGGMGGADLRGVSCFHCGSLNMVVVDIATALYVTISVSLSSSSSTSLSSSSCSEPLMSKLTKVSVSEAGVSG